MKGLVKLAHTKVGGAIVKNSPAILAGIAVVGLVTTVVIACKAHEEANYILEEKEWEKSKEEGDSSTRLTNKEKFQFVWKLYLPAAVVGGTTIACIIGSNHINMRRNAALASAYVLEQAAFKTYKDKVAETFGERKERSVRDEIAKDKISKKPIEEKEIVITGDGEVLCFDTMSGRYFYSTIEKVKAIENALNKRLINEMYISLNEFYYELGLRNIQLGDDLGWNIDDNLIEFDFSSQIADNGKPCLVIDYLIAPRYDFRNY